VLGFAGKAEGLLYLELSYF